MCLVFAKKYEQKGDIVCYKVCKRLKKSGKDVCHPDLLPYYQLGNRQLAGDTVFFSVHRNEPYVLNELKSTGQDDSVLINDSPLNYIDGGAFHTFTSEEDAINFYYTKLNPDSDIVVIKCIIPKDSNFIYIGDFNVFGTDLNLRKYTVYKSFASEKVLPVEVVWEAKDHQLDSPTFV